MRRRLTISWHLAPGPFLPEDYSSGAGDLSGYRNSLLIHRRLNASAGLAVSASVKRLFLSL